MGGQERHRLSSGHLLGVVPEPSFKRGSMLLLPLLDLGSRRCFPSPRSRLSSR